MDNDLRERRIEVAGKDGVDADGVTAFARDILRRLIFRLIFVSTMDRLAAVTVGFIGGLTVGCLLT